MKTAIRIVLTAVLLLSLPTAAVAGNFLWSIQGQSNTVWLLGSMHLMPPSAYPLDPEILSAYRGSDRLVMETDLDAIRGAEGQMRLMQSAQLPKGESLGTTLTRAEYESLQAIAGRMGLPMDLLDRMRPWFVALTLELGAYRLAGFRPDLGTESYLATLAAKDKKPVSGLESAAAHLDLLAGVSETVSREMLASTLAEFGAEENLPAQILSIWQSGDVTALQRYTDDIRQQFPATYAYLISDRNRRWVPQVEALLHDSDNVLVVVGSAHLVGDDGLPALLAARGHTLKRGHVQ